MVQRKWYDGKQFDKLLPEDQRLKRAFPIRMTDDVETRVTITLVTGFELFNTRPYHNLETWSSGYNAVISEKDTPNLEEHERHISAEDLDVLLDRIEAALKKNRERSADK